MCGILAQSGICTEHEAEQAASLFQYRGPDGTHIYAGDTVTLVQHRLAVIDPRAIADQPFWNSDRSIGVIFNGEIYNFRELRMRIPGTVWRTEGDTEVLLKLYEEYGSSFARFLDGMFAIIIYDRRTNELVAIRDTFGVKPLYYAATGTGLICASELKGVAEGLKAGGVSLSARTDVIDLYLALGYVPSPDTLVEGIFMLPPGHVLTYDLSKRRFGIEAFPREAIQVEDPIVALKKSIVRNTVADVPLGLFLSGGIDSTFIAHTLAEAGMHPAAFTLDIPNRFDVPYARRVAEQYGLYHEVVPFTQERFNESYALIRMRTDTPTADSSLIPTFALAREARKRVTVVLSGEGGDEVFLGYDRHKTLVRLAAKERAPMARLASGGLPLRLRRALAAASGDAATYYMLAAGIVPNATAAREFARLSADVRPADFDLRYYLENDLLRKIDLATMYASLEGRVPFCSELVLAAARTEEGRLVTSDTKALLKEHLAQTLPHELIYRQKSGFSAPFMHFANGSPEVIEDLAALPSFVHDRLGDRADFALQAAEHNHYARYGLLSLMHAYQNLGL